MGGDRLATIIALILNRVLHLYSVVSSPVADFSHHSQLRGDNLIRPTRYKRTIHASRMPTRENDSSELMGCGSSKTPKSLSPETLERYESLDAAILSAEAETPSAAINQSLTRLERISAQLASAEHRMNRFVLEIYGSAHQTDPDTALAECYLELAVDRDVNRALEHEEFIANLNRQVLSKHEVELLIEKQNEMDREVRSINLKVNQLQELYQEHDDLIDKILDNKNREAENDLENELDKLRSFRDALAGGSRDWAYSTSEVDSAVEAMGEGLKHLEGARASTQPTERFTAISKARNCFQKAALCVQDAQGVLERVQFPYCSAREIDAVTQAIIYMFTDTQVSDRHKHALQIYTNFHQRSVALAQWIRETMDMTLNRDVADVDKKIEVVSKRLRELRAQAIRQKMGGGYVTPFMAMKDPPPNVMYGPSFGTTQHVHGPPVQVHQPPHLQEIYSHEVRGHSILNEGNFTTRGQLSRQGINLKNNFNQRRNQLGDYR